MQETAAVGMDPFLQNALGALLSVTAVSLIASLFLGLLTLNSLDLHIKLHASLDEEE